VLYALLLAMTPSGGTTPAFCPGITTMEVDACVSAEFEQADAVLNRYYAVALRQARTAGDAATATGLTQAERSWLAYRNAECDAAAEVYRGGTIATSVSITCRTRLTHLRTYVLWRDWLTYPDGTPALLPRPAVETTLSDGRR
jgi:uncharacterized protein YecT (DUF1311 family)